jgi:glucoamylase
MISTSSGSPGSPVRPGSRALGKLVAVVAALAVSLGLALTDAAPAIAATASGGPGSTPYWNEDGGVQGFATALSSSSKVWYTLADGALQNVYYPETDEPDTYGLQYYVTDGSSFTDSETADTSHAIALADPTSLTWTQTNTATSGKYTITKTYVADPARSVVLVDTTFTNNTSTPLHLYADYQPYLANQGDGNTGGTDSGSGDLVAENGSVASAMSASTGFTATSTGYVGTGSSGATQLSTDHGLATSYSGVSSSGHIDQVAQIPVSASGSTSFTLALAFDSTEAAAVTDAAASLATGFGAAMTSYESGWHSWIAGLDAPPASVSSSPSLLRQYEISLMEVKADEDKTYAGAFVAAPSVPWGGSVSAASAGAHGYHLVWTRDEYEMATSLMSAGDTADAKAALAYLLQYEVTSSGYVKQNSWLNGTEEWGGQQLDEVADPIILAYQLGVTDPTTWATLKEEAGYLVSNGPVTGEERWEEIGGYSPSTIAAEIAGLVCASAIATDNGDTTDAATYLATARTWAADVDGWTYTTTGSYGNGDYFLRITQDGNPNSGATVSLANGGGSYDDRDVTDAGFLELVRLGIKSATATDITDSLTAVDDSIEVTTPEGPVWHRYTHDGYGETASGADYTGAGVGNPWPVLTGERGEYDVALGDTTDAQAMLQTMQGAATPGGQITEQVWGSSTPSSVNGWTLGQADNSSTPLMWAMGQYVRLANDISHGSDLDTPGIVCTTFGTCAASKPSTPTGLSVTGTTPTTVALAWTASSNSPTGYRILRNGTQVGSSTGTSYTDTGLTAATSYSYTVESYNSAGTSAPSAAVTATTGTGYTQTVDVTVPVNTAATGDGVYLDGNFSVLGTGGTDWAASGIAMTKVDDTHYTATVTAATQAALQYKYVLGASWSNVEKSASCADIGNRTLTVNDGSTADTVLNWGGPNSCGSAEAVIDVTVPTSTPSSGTVYIAGDFSALGTGMSSSNDWSAGLYPMARTGADTWQVIVPAVPGTTLAYKFDLNGTWTNVEEAASCATQPNRSFYFNGSGSSYTAADTVSDWAGLNGC